MGCGHEQTRRFEENTTLAGFGMAMFTFLTLIQTNGITAENFDEFKSNVLARLAEYGNQLGFGDLFKPSAKTESETAALSHQLGLCGPPVPLFRCHLQQLYRLLKRSQEPRTQQGYYDLGYELAKLLQDINNEITALQQARDKRESSSCS
ncbi:MAG: hypothetical protein WC553_00670 [Patescibacteria group bacterium]|jgi:hypothetical protein